ncbi:unnamed protein product [Diatraea saccharalis]|uniref:Zinc finger PHD-type domain-containing protein n=1 Tax=Diatraea saccharalis TaxID=40085 RepID=A0A9N9WD65_9NEOP|nr:unnamed protein product [Diatraea saccharalis]
MERNNNKGGVGERMASTSYKTQNPMELTWGCCTMDLDDSAFLQCAKCKHAYHTACLPGTYIDPATSDGLMNFLCPLCDKRKPGKNDNTPIRFNSNAIMTRSTKRQALNSPPNEKPITNSEMQEIIKSMLMEVQVSMRNMITSTLNEEFKTFTDELKEVKESMNFMNIKYEEVRKEQAETKERMKLLKSESDIAKAKLKDLESRVNYLEQNARANNLEIQCVPEKKDENLLNIIEELGKTINCKVTTEQLAYFTRTPKLNKDNDRPKSIIVQFITPKKKDAFLAAAISFNKANPNNKLNSSHAGIPGKMTAIFVTEHLSMSNKALHAAARRAAKEKNYKYVWIRNSRIFMRKTDNSPYLIIKSMEALQNLD